jgi:hypothetical protein
MPAQTGFYPYLKCAAQALEEHAPNMSSAGI